MADNKLTEQETTSKITFSEALTHFSIAYKDAKTQYEKLNLKLWKYHISQEYMSSAYTLDVDTIYVTSYEAFDKLPLLPKIDIIKKGSIYVEDLDQSTEDFLITLITSYSGRLT